MDAKTAAVKHFLDIDAYAVADLRTLLESAGAMKAGVREETNWALLSGRVLAMIFDKPSTRTRVSFDVAMRHLGGETIVLNSSDMQLGRGESIADTGRVLSRYVDGIMLRTGPHEHLVELAENATIPVINGLTDKSHPCQVMADIMTFEEKLGPIEGRRIAWVGDVNNVTTSWMQAAAKFDFSLAIAAPEKLVEAADASAQAANQGGDIAITNDPAEAVAGADCVVTDVWVSMGQDESDGRRALLTPYQVNAALMAKAADGAVFMHCLPVHRGDEVTADVIDGAQSVVFDEAENRLHIQKAILARCLNAK